MRILIRVLAIAVLCGLGVWLWVVFNPSPEKAIRRQLLKLSQTATYSHAESPIATLGWAQELSSFFSRDTRLGVDFPGVREQELAGRDEIVQAALAWRSALQSTKVEFLDLQFIISTGAKSAEVKLTAAVTVPGERDFVPQAFRFYFKEIDGDWLIIKVEPFEVLN